MPIATVTALRARPDWLDDDAIVERALDVKRRHPPSPHFWERLAVLAQLGHDVADANLAFDDCTYVCASALIRELTTELPGPHISPCGPRRASSAPASVCGRSALLDDLA